ncbi:MAG: hypothetical protein ACR2QL_12145 [Woeseiaceae bacterium]
MKRVMFYISVLPMMAFATSASATTCDEVTFSEELTSRYPDIARSCMDVIDRDGEQFVKTKVRLTRAPNGNYVTFKFLHADGTEGPSYSTELDSSWRTTSQGREYRVRDLTRGQELSVYFPFYQWEVHIEADDVMDEVIVTSAVMAAEPEPAMLPSTAGNMPLFALFGALALMGAGMVRLTRS